MPQVFLSPTSPHYFSPGIDVASYRCFATSHWIVCRYVPGTHKAPLREHVLSPIKGFSQRVDRWEPADVEAEIACNLKAGDALVHHVGVLHRAEPNTTDDRESVICHGYCCPSLHGVTAWGCRLAASHGDSLRGGVVSFGSRRVPSVPGCIARQ